MIDLRQNKIMQIDEIFLYKCLFVIYTVFLATEFSQMRSFTLLKALIFGGGILIVIYESFKTKGEYLVRNKLLLAFMIFSTLTLIVNNGKSGNLKFYLITLIQLFILTSIKRKNNIKSVKEEFKKLNFVFILTTSIFTMISLIMYVFKISISTFSITDPTRSDLIKGVYVISTSAGLICYLSLMATVVSLIILRKEMRDYKFLSIFYLFNCFLQGYGLFLSGARGSLISFFAFIVVLGFLFISNKKIRVGIILSLITIILCFPIYKSHLPNINLFNKDTEGNFFNGRLLLWENGYNHAFKNYKFLGTGAGNMVEVTETLSDTYLPGIEGGRLHNIYLDVLCSNGILGFLAFMTFIFYEGIKLYMGSFSNRGNKENRIYIKCITAFLVSILVINIVESIMVYVLSIAATMFWIYMGYGMKLISNNSSSLENYK
ncbi:O-antigen ligase family protein [Clostridium cadaveris]|uniref:O-antigen ligase family protein n=1 Tax=Clostridium cadaveris TaxID=1529 RepID=UPI0004063E1F|nr:O-antigen ligase family protein [Clostridium cadaveris]